jgi:hypothetical protein
MDVCLCCGTVINEVKFVGNFDSKSENGFLIHSNILNRGYKTKIGNNYEIESSYKNKRLAKTQNFSLNHNDFKIARIQLEIFNLCTLLDISKDTAIKINQMAQKVHNKLEKGVYARSPINLAAAMIYHGKKVYKYQAPLNQIIKSSGQTRQKILRSIKQTSMIFSQLYLKKNILRLKDTKKLIKNFWDKRNNMNRYITDSKNSIDELTKDGFNMSIKFLQSEYSSFLKLSSAEMVAGVCIGFTMVCMKMGKIEDIIRDISNHFHLSCVKLLQSMLKIFRCRNEDATEKGMIKILPGYYNYMFLNPLIKLEPRLKSIKRDIYSIMTNLKSTKLSRIEDDLFQSILKEAIGNLYTNYKNFGHKHNITIAVSLVSASIIKHNLRSICPINAIANNGSVGYESIKQCFKDMGLKQ